MRFDSQARAVGVRADDAVRRGEHLFPVLFIERAEGIGVAGDGVHATPDGYQARAKAIFVRSGDQVG